MPNMYSKEAVRFKPDEFRERWERALRDYGRNIKIPKSPPPSSCSCHHCLWAKLNGSLAR